MDEQTPQQDTPVMTATPVTPVNPPSNYLIWAILATLFCCLPLGIVSIIYAAQVNTKWQAGDVDGAKSSSRNALIWTLVSVGIGIVSVIIAFIFGLAAAILNNVFNW